MHIFRYRGTFFGVLLLPACLSLFFLTDVYLHNRVSGERAGVWLVMGVLYIGFCVASLAALVESLAHKLALTPSEVVLTKCGSVTRIPLERGTRCVWHIGRIGEPIVELVRGTHRVRIRLLRFSRHDRWRIVAFLRRHLPKECHYNWRLFRDEQKRYWLQRRSTLRGAQPDG